MERKENITNRYLQWYLVVTFSLGLLGHSFEGSRGLMITLSPLVLLMSSLVVCYPVMKNANQGTIIWCVFAFLLTFLPKSLGLKAA